SLIAHTVHKTFRKTAENVYFSASLIASFISTAGVVKHFVSHLYRFRFWICDFRLQSSAFGLSASPCQFSILDWRFWMASQAFQGFWQFHS
ncbi:hypothetical protein, partial [Thermoleptolyngbya sp.]